MSTGNEKQKIMIVDDSEMNRSILADMLGDEYEIIEAVDGAEAVARLNMDSTDISLMLLDIVMPNMDGFEVLKVMQEKMWIDKIPVLVISGESSIKVEQDCFDYGVSDFIHKPFDNALVRKRVENVVSLFQYQRELEEISE